ncbi:MAG: SPOR domain-containing protein, partial [Hyphomicrobiaceae bacterium]|nr:SPOR domain-containing protein [Hyphomicrobiaceae bacterium]
EEGDRWLLMAWDPRRPGLEFAVTPGTPEAAEESQLIYVQVSSTSNQDWAVNLATNLRRAGMQATVLNPRTIDEPYRVVLGPYPTRDQAESTGRSLGLPFWIFTLDTATTIP